MDRHATGVPSVSAMDCGVPDLSDLNIDLSDLIDDLLAFVYLDIGNGATGPAEAGIATATLVHRISLVREAVQRGQEACKRLQGCDLDLPAQKKLLNAVGTACITKRQLLCDLKQELQELSNHTDMFSV